MANSNQKRASEAQWQIFAARHHLKVSRHGHGLLLEAVGLVRGFEVSIREQDFGVELVGWNVAPANGEVVLCDQEFLEWACLPSQIQAGAAVKKQARSLGILTSSSSRAYFVPSDFRPVVARTGMGEFDQRFRQLVGRAELLPTPALAMLANLPYAAKFASEPQIILACLQASPSDLLLEQFVHLVQLLRPSP